MHFRWILVLVIPRDAGIGGVTRILELVAQEHMVTIPLAKCDYILYLINRLMADG